MTDRNPNPLLHLAALGLAAAHEMPDRREYPLLGTTVGITRQESRSAELRDRLLRLGAAVALCPTIEIAGPENPAPLDAALASLENYDWVVFTSANGVERTIDRLMSTGRDVRSFGTARIAAIGPATATALSSRGLRVDVVPEAYVAESLVDSLLEHGRIAGSRVLLARAAIARDVLPDALRAAGAIVDVVEAYRTVTPDGAGEAVRRLLAGPGRIVVTFTSSSTVSNFVSLAGETPVSGVRAACIGPVTSSTARDFGFSVVVEATTYTTDGLVDGIERWARAHEGGQGGHSA